MLYAEDALVPKYQISYLLTTLIDVPEDELDIAREQIRYLLEDNNTNTVTVLQTINKEA